MTRPVRIGNACGFWGDRLEAASEMLAREPELDFLTLDFLAEVSMSILALQRSRDPQAGWPRDFLEIVRSIAPYWRDGGRCRVIANAGGLNPLACAQACCEALKIAGCAGRSVAVVSGDDVLDLVASRTDDSPPVPRHGGEEELLRNLDTGQAIADVRNRIVTANAYLGARPIAEALARGADLVITGRVADPSLTVGAVRTLVRLVLGRLGPSGRRHHCRPLDRVRHATHRRHLDRLAANAGRPVPGLSDCRSRRGRELRGHETARQRRPSLQGDGQGTTSVRDRRPRSVPLSRRHSFAAALWRSMTAEMTAFRFAAPGDARRRRPTR